MANTKKLRNNIFQKSSVFRKITISYIALLVISVIATGSIAYFKTYSIVYNNIQNTNRNNIKNLEHNMHTLLDETNSLSLSLQGWPAVKKIFTMNGQLDTSWVNDDELFNLVYVLRKHKTLHSYIDNIAIVFRDVNLVIDCTSASSTWDDFFEYRFSFDSEKFHRFEDFDFTVDSRLLANCKVGRYSQPNQDCLLYFKAIPNTTGVSKAMLLVTLKPESVKLKLDSNKIFEDKMWFITNDDEEVLLSNASHSAAELPQLSVPETSDFYSGYARCHGKFCAFYYTHSDTLAQSFYIFSPMNNILKQFLDTTCFMVISLFVMLILGIFLSYHYSARSYAPIQKIASIAILPGIKRTSGNEPEKVNEYSIIEESLHFLTVENDVLKESISSHMPIIRNNLLTKTLSGITFTTEDKAELERYSIYFPHPCFLVSIITLNALDLHTERELSSSSASGALFFSCIEEYFSALELICYLTELPGNAISCALIINSASDNYDFLDKAFTGLPDFLQGKFHATVAMDISIGISLTAKEPVHFKTLYFQALQASEYCCSLSHSNVIWYSKLKENSSVSYNFTLNDELILNNLLKSGQKEEALAFTNSVLNDFFAQGRIRREDASYIFNQILFICAKTLHEMQARSAEIIDFKKLHTLNLFAQMNEYTLTCVADTCDTINKMKKLEESGLSQRIVTYINENYQNHDLTLTYLVEHFHVPAIYISKAVKKISGANFIDYLNRLRIDEAKRLLTETSQIIRDIGNKAGYDSDKNFIRVFKKYEGITPGQYRKIHGSL